MWMDMIKLFVFHIKWLKIGFEIHWFWLTHCGRVTHICVSKLTITGLDNGLLPGWHQAIIWTNDGILLIQNLGTNFSEILIKINTFSLKKMHLKMSSGRRQPSCFGLNVLISIHISATPIRDHSGYGLRQWEKALHSYAFSDWPSPYPEWSLSTSEQNQFSQTFYKLKVFDASWLRRW